ncbi:hypothetical protein [Shewanella sp. cp20]|uniref:hypothetical protein n=1 Tax=Shewanella sp. cp20 TaxID=1521167 RepID=UPI000A7A41E5
METAPLLNEQLQTDSGAEVVSEAQAEATQQAASQQEAADQSKAETTSAEANEAASVAAEEAPVKEVAEEAAQEESKPKPKRRAPKAKVVAEEETSVEDTQQSLPLAGEAEASLKEEVQAELDLTSTPEEVKASQEAAPQANDDAAQAQESVVAAEVVEAAQVETSEVEAQEAKAETQAPAAQEPAAKESSAASAPMAKPAAIQAPSTQVKPAAKVQEKPVETESSEEAASIKADKPAAKATSRFGSMVSSTMTKPEVEARALVDTPSGRQYEPTAKEASAEPAKRANSANSEMARP